MSSTVEAKHRVPGTMDGAGGIAAKEPDVEAFPLLVSTTLDGKGKNTIRMEMIPVACWKLNDGRFAFGSSFVLAESREEFMCFWSCAACTPARHSQSSGTPTPSAMTSTTNG